MALLGRALVSWISADLSVKVSRIVSDPGSPACPLQFLFCPQEPLHFCSGGWKASGDKDQEPDTETIILEDQGGTYALSWVTSPVSAVIGSHQLPHALADVDRLDLLGLEAEIAGPDCRGLSGQQPIGTLSHACALSVEPFLAGGLTQNGILVVVHLTPTGTTRIHQAWRRLGP